MRRAVVLLALALAAPAALAECPDAGDMAGAGVRITYSDDWSTRTWTTERGTTIEVTTTPGADGFFIESEKSIHIVSEGTWKDGAPVTSEVTRYRLIGEGPLPEATPGMRWTGEFEVIKADGSTSVARQVINGADEIQITIGDCAYRAIPLHLKYEGEGEPGRTTALSLLPDLGVVVLTAAGDAGGLYSEFYRAAAISEVKP